MPAATFMFPPVDLVFGGSANDGLQGTSLGAIVPNDYGNRVSWVKVFFGIAIYGRVRSFLVTGSVHNYDPVSGDTIGDQSFSFDLNAVPFDAMETPMVSEIELCKHGGWYGTDGDVILYFGQGIMDLAQTDSAGQDRGQVGFTFQTPAVSGILPYADTSGVTFGKSSDDDLCIVAFNLPVNRDGSFDATGQHSFSFQLGAPVDNFGTTIGAVSGSVTITPSAYWGHGGKWDVVTGAPT